MRSLSLPASGGCQHASACLRVTHSSLCRWEQPSVLWSDLLRFHLVRMLVVAFRAQPRSSRIISPSRTFVGCPRQHRVSYLVTQVTGMKALILGARCSARSST